MNSSCVEICFYVTGSIFLCFAKFDDFIINVDFVIIIVTLAGPSSMMSRISNQPAALGSANSKENWFNFQMACTSTLVFCYEK